MVSHVSGLVHGLHGVWCSFQGWSVGTLGNTLSGCVTQDSRVLSTPLTLFAWLHAQVRPSVVHV